MTPKIVKHPSFDKYYYVTFDNSKVEYLMYDGTIREGLAKNKFSNDYKNKETWPGLFLSEAEAKKAITVYEYRKQFVVEKNLDDIVTVFIPRSLTHSSRQYLQSNLELSMYAQNLITEEGAKNTLNKHILKKFWTNGESIEKAGKSIQHEINVKLKTTSIDLTGKEPITSPICFKSKMFSTVAEHASYLASKKEDFFTKVYVTW